MRTALKLHAVLVVGSSGGLGHLQSLEQPLLRPVRRPVESTLNSTRWHPPSEREAGAAGTVMLCKGADKGRIDNKIRRAYKGSHRPTMLIRRPLATVCPMSLTKGIRPYCMPFVSRHVWSGGKGSLCNEIKVYREQQGPSLLTRILPHVGLAQWRIGDEARALWV